MVSGDRAGIPYRSPADFGSCAMSEPALQSIPSAPAKPIPRLFHTELPFWKAMPKKLALKAAEVQEWAKTRLVKLPGWNQLERAAHVMTTPVRGLASGALHYVPGLERLDWMFEAQKVTSTHPVILAGSLTWAVWRGLHSTPYGHIGTDPLIFPVLAAISYYNPFLGAVSGFFFGIGDLAQKLVVNDIYGTAKWDPDYLWSLAGYTMSYSALVVAGMIPGLVGRTFQM